MIEVPGPRRAPPGAAGFNQNDPNLNRYQISPGRKVGREVMGAVLLKMIHTTGLCCHVSFPSEVSAHRHLSNAQEETATPTESQF